MYIRSVFKCLNYLIKEVDTGWSYLSVQILDILLSLLNFTSKVLASTLDIETTVKARLERAQILSH